MLWLTFVTFWNINWKVMEICPTVWSVRKVSECLCLVTSSVSHVQLPSNHFVLVTYNSTGCSVSTLHCIFHTGLDILDRKCAMSTFSRVLSTKESQSRCFHSTGNLTASSSNHVARPLWQRQSEKRSPLYRPPWRWCSGGGWYVTDTHTLCSP